jgi:pyridoxine 5-phosphate synthase
MQNKTITLGVNIDHVATLRQARGGAEPSVILAAQEAEAAGADGVTVHLREDRRHIQDKDVYGLRKVIQRKLNLEMALSADIITIALAVHPDQITIVPEKRRELTTEGGLDVLKEWRKLEGVLPHFKKQGIEISIFVDPDVQQIRKAALVGADAVELHTGQYAERYQKNPPKKELQDLIKAAREAHNLGLVVNAGHGLNYQNVMEVCSVPFVEELNIGHAIISRAVFVGLYKAVKDMKKCIKSALQ